MTFIVFLVLLAILFSSVTKTDLIVFATIIVAICVSVLLAMIYAFRQNREAQRIRECSATSSGSRVSSASSEQTAFRKVTKCVSPTYYNVIYNASAFDDNLNYQLYLCDGLYSQTERMRTNKKIEAFSPEEAEDLFRSLGYTDPISVRQIAFDPPTPAQIEACRQHGETIPRKCSSADMSYYIDKMQMHDSAPHPDLLHYATRHKIKLSYYVGKRDLYDIIWGALEDADKIAFFIFCIYRCLSDDRNADIDESRYRRTFYMFAEQKSCDKSFLNSMKRYAGHDLRFFGKLQVGDTVYSGGSDGTIAYKSAVHFLNEKNLL